MHGFRTHRPDVYIRLIKFCSFRIAVSRSINTKLENAANLKCALSDYMGLVLFIPQ